MVDARIWGVRVDGSAPRSGDEISGLRITCTKSTMRGCKQRRRVQGETARDTVLHDRSLRRSEGVVSVSEWRGALSRPARGDMAVVKDVDHDGIESADARYVRGWTGPDAGAPGPFVTPLAGAGAGGLDGGCAVL